MEAYTRLRTHILEIIVVLPMLSKSMFRGSCQHSDLFWLDLKLTRNSSEFFFLKESVYKQ